MIEEDIEKFIFEQIKEDSKNAYDSTKEAVHEATK